MNGLFPGDDTPSFISFIRKKTSKNKLVCVLPRKYTGRHLANGIWPMVDLFRESVENSF